jgi:signal recognition particle receptor subunit beta
MTVFDSRQQRICVRVVYDGVASAGKTTNLRHLAELFATQRTCELLSPSEQGGRTLYFDWLQIAAGMACGFPLICQVITVPGQVVLTPRRRHLLSTADVVVYVCDSAEALVGRALDGLATFDEVERERGRPIPLVVQANKQDQTSALSGAALVAALGRPGTPVVEAIASDGVGVIDTFVTGVRTVVRSITARMEQGEVHVPVRPAESADAALDQLVGVQVDPEWAIEMLLEEASNSFAVGDVVEAEPAVAHDDSPPTWRPEIAHRGMPPLPNEHVPTGFVWPAHTGRAALRALAAEGKLNEAPARDGSGRIQVDVGDYVLTTGTDQRFETSELARQALVRSARERTQLGTLLAGDVVVVVQTAADGASWLWTMTPRLPTLAALLAAREEGASRVTLLSMFGSAIGEALKIEAAHGTALDLAPRSFALEGGFVRYVGELLPASPYRDLGRALDELLTGLAAEEGALDHVVVALESSITARLSAEEMGKIAGALHWSDEETAPPGLREARRRIETALRAAQAAA